MLKGLIDDCVVQVPGHIGRWASSLDLANEEHVTALVVRLDEFRPAPSSGVHDHWSLGGLCTNRGGMRVGAGDRADRAKSLYYR